MHRTIILLKDAAGYLFRSSLPRARGAISEPDPGEFRRLFLMTFVAAFLAFYGFLS